MIRRCSWGIAVAVGMAVALLAVPFGVLAADDGTSCKSKSGQGTNRILDDCQVPGDPADPESNARRFIDAHLGELGMLESSAALELVETKQGLAGPHVRFRQMLGGYPVYGATVLVAQDLEGGVRRLSSSYHSARIFAVPPKKAITPEQAVQIARDAVAREAGAPAQGLQVNNAGQVWFPRKDGKLTLAWEFAIVGANPPVDFLSIVGASGEVLLLRDRLVYGVLGQGKVFRPNPVQSSGDTTLTINSPASAINAQLVDMYLPGLNAGTGMLKGKWVEVRSTLYPVVDEPTRVYSYAFPHPGVEQVNTYFAIDSAQRYVRSLGFNDDRATPNGIHGFPTIVDAHCKLSEGSFYSPTSDSICLGDGDITYGVPDGEDADIIVHEYGHAIQHAQNSKWDSGDETNAMGEGFSDYLAASIHSGDGNAGYQQANAACVGEWDSKGYVINGNPAPRACLRRVDENLTYDDRVGESHWDGQIWSRALWDIRAAIGQSVANGPSVADQIILEHHYLVNPQGSSYMSDAALAMISVDADLFGGVNEAALRKAFCDRKILTSVADCTVASHTKTVIAVSKDTFVRQLLPDRNDGASPRLRVKGTPGEKTRALLRFDGLSAITDLSTVKSAVLEMTVAAADLTSGRFGRTDDVHPLLYDFTEGNGVGAGAPEANKTLGTGPGATWNCSIDADISNTTPNCSASGVNWIGGRVAPATFGAGTSVPPVVVTNGMTGRVRWAVTSDVKKGVRGWAVKSTFDVEGTVDYLSKESPEAQSDTTKAPRLLITFN